MASPARILAFLPAPLRWQTLEDLTARRGPLPDWVPLENLDPMPATGFFGTGLPAWSSVEELVRPWDAVAARIIPIAYLRENSIFSTFSEILLDDFA